LGGNNLWILRKDGYLLKVEKISTSSNLEQYVKSLNPSIVYKVDVTIFKGQTAIKLTPEEDLPIKGDTYLVQGKNGILRVWFKTYVSGENPEDEKMVQKIADTFQFIK
jgi:hypothetical protein